MASGTPLDTLAGGDYDFHEQSFNLSTPEGIITFTLDELQKKHDYDVGISINYGAQLGASLLLLIVICLLTKTDKMPSPVFLLNCTSLAINFVRLLLTSLFYTGPWSDIYAVLSNDFSAVPEQAYQLSVAPIVLTLLLVVCIQVSLILQLKCVCVTLPRLWRYWITGVSAFVALQAIGLRLAYAVKNAQCTYSGEPIGHWQWLESACTIAVTVSICWFAAAFVAKLGYAIRQRRKLGMRKWGVMNIVFVMGLQTMLIPALFSILQYTARVPAASSNTLTCVVIFLPLSAMWASSSIEGAARRPAYPLEGSTRPLALSRKRMDDTFTDETISVESPLKDKFIDAEAAGRV